MRRPYPPARPSGARALDDRTAPLAPPRPAAFTLLELMVVVAIMGLLAVSSMPAIRSLTQANAVASGSRQVMDHFALARQLAVRDRQTVYVVFVPPGIGAHVPNLQAIADVPRRNQLLRQITNLVSGQYTAYALYSKRTVGDQPGRLTPRYLSAESEGKQWKHLPEGMFFATNKYADLGRAWTNTAVLQTDPTNRPLPHAEFPFPTADSPPWRLPYIAFSPSGRVAYEGPVTPPNPEAVMTLSRGSVLYPKDNQGRTLLSASPDVVATPRGNRTDVAVNWLTGRARAVEAKLP